MTSRRVPTHTSLPIEVEGSRRYPLGMPPADFLDNYWQKHPLLIRGAFAGFQLPLQADDLAGLACEEMALSRIVLRDPEKDRWEARQGPFAESDFGKLPTDHWTLLVQDVDKWDPDVAALLNPFRFLPSWRIDDVMVSYAEDGGGVGAHVDQYDVFLLQGQGRRCWAIDIDPDAPKDFRDDVELRLLRHFTSSHEWLLEPGDMLYLPPGIAHEGMAKGAGMTFSIGMRAPAESELLLDLAEHVAEQLPDELRYQDPDLRPAPTPGEIDESALNRLSASLGPASQLLPRDALAEWFGCFITRYRSAQFAAPPKRRRSRTQLLNALASGATFVRHPWTRFAWVRRRGGATLFASGTTYRCTLSMARWLCSERIQHLKTPPDEAAQDVLLALINDGHLALRRGSTG
ncbi:cupin domain-containing protein [Oleiagrimonas sp.]|jgi:50S ribosomal protein L16 3-hydroxylase|uniref:cupin domain-containing protein n=1 Tax=Oleiagrimonas sp. TaxID=2010330 RepID=UPI002634951E|nr:cupin domain-containing protein [Oleiagrimonas sp.]MDA3914375.1 cupin domain-containing protein [Oleiagrimonas sp.]